MKKTFKYTQKYKHRKTLSHAKSMHANTNAPVIVIEVRKHRALGMLCQHISLLA
jgi:hypothetical protein